MEQNNYGLLLNQEYEYAVVNYDDFRFDIIRSGAELKRSKIEPIDDYLHCKVNKNDDEITVVVSTEPSSAIEFGTRYSSNVTVLEPLTLRNEVINLLQKGLNRYNEFAS